MFTDIRPAIHAQLVAYTGVATVLTGVPTTVQVTPAWATQFLGGERIGAGTATFHWRYVLHAIIQHQVPAPAESEIDTLVPLAFAAFSPRLLDSGGIERAALGGAALMSWFENVRSGDTDGYITFGAGDTAKVYRHITLTLVVKTQEAF